MTCTNEARVRETVSSVRMAVSKTASAIDRNDIPEAIAGLLEWIDHSNPGIPRDALDGIVTGLRKGDWGEAQRIFHSRRFISEDGKFLLLGRYTYGRVGRPGSKMSMLYGDIKKVRLFVAPVDLDQLITSYIGCQFEPVSPVIPFLTSVETGRELFFEHTLSSTSWPELDFPGGGPTMVNLLQMERRCEDVIHPSIGDIFHRPSAEYIQEPLSRSGIERYQLLEQQFQEVGHATGWGRGKKNRDDLIPTTWLRGIEEFRAGAVGLDLASRLLPEDEFSILIRCRWMRIFGWDAHQQVRTQGSPEAIAALLEFALLFEGGFLSIEKGKLALRRMTSAGLAQAVLSIRSTGVDLTRKELATDPALLPTVYGAVQVSQCAHALFEKYVRGSCRNRFTIG